MYAANEMADIDCDVSCVSGNHLVQIVIKLCLRAARSCVQPLFCRRDLHINSVTLKLAGDLDIRKMYLCTEYEVAI